MRLHRVLRVGVLLLLTVGVALGQATLPDTVPAKMLTLWLEGFNSGDPAKITGFIREHRVGGQPPQGTMEEAVERSQGFRDMVGGGFDIFKVVSSAPDSIVVLLRARNGVNWSNLTLTMDAAKPNLVSSIRLMQTEAPPEARPARMPQARLAEDVDRYATKLAVEDQFSGVILLAKDGQPFFQKAYGDADREKKIPNRVDTKFRIGSMNKMFTSVAIAQLVQAGKLKYTDTLAQVLPDYPDKATAAKITIHHLLTHTSGLGDYFGPEFARKKDSLHELKDYLQFFVGQPLLFEPGTEFHYSNAGMLVAGLVVEKVSGQNYFDYVRDHIYKPAGMKDSDSWEKTKPQPNQSRGYMRGKDGKWESNYDDLPLMGSSAGGGDSTAPDLLRFDQALRGNRLVNAELTTLITTGKVKSGPREMYGYAFEEVMVDGKRMVGHGGGAPGMNAKLDMYWDSGYTVIVMANLDPPAAQQVAEYVSQRIQQ